MSLTPRAFAAGCSSTRLSDSERAFFRDARPCGLILFQRNCETPEQVRRLVGDVAEAIGGDAFMVLIDQEGGRVRRLRPPAWRDYPAARAFGKLYKRDPELGKEAARLCARVWADDLRACGINLNATPVLDIPVAGAHDIIGDRAYGKDADAVIALGRAVAEGFMDGGVIPVIKHIPGHGRARADSHENLPVIDTPLEELERTDFRPFTALSGMPAAMTAHILLTELDAERPVSISPVIITEVIRGSIGFGGLLMSDDLSMKALDGSLAERAGAVIAAGCDMALHCNGVLAEMEEVAGVVPELAGKALDRFAAAMAVTANSRAYDAERAAILFAEAAAAGN